MTWVLQAYCRQRAGKYELGEYTAAFRPKRHWDKTSEQTNPGHFIRGKHCYACQDVTMDISVQINRVSHS